MAEQDLWANVGSWRDDPIHQLKQSERAAQLEAERIAEQEELRKKELKATEDELVPAREPIDLFPISEEASSEAFSTIFNKNLPQAAIEQLKEGLLFQNNNPEVFSLVEMIVQAPSVYRPGGIALGSYLIHKAIREEARVKGLVLPCLTGNFVDDYSVKELHKLRARIGETELDIAGVSLQLKMARNVRFKNLEPVFSQRLYDVLKKDLRKPEESGEYYISVLIYMLFKDGLTDPKNFLVPRSWAEREKTS